MSLATFRLPALPPIELPPLPDVEKDLLKLALTHASANGGPHRGMDLAHGTLRPEENYRKLALVGDGLVDSVVALLLQEMYPSMTIGTTTKLRSLLVDNEMLSELCKRYHLNERMVAAADARAVIIHQTTPTASVFEAMVGAVFYGSLDALLDTNPTNAMGEGMVRVVDWLYPLFRPIATFAVEEMRTFHETSSEKWSTSTLDPGEPTEGMMCGATAALNTWVSKQKGAAHVSYVQSPAGDCWRVQCTLKCRDGVFEEEAVRRSTQVARTAAAWKVATQRGGIL